MGGTDSVTFEEEMIRHLAEHRKRYPLMTEADIVKFIFQGMLGVGHLIRNPENVLAYLQSEMASLAPDAEEPLWETLSPQWLRLNLRPAMARGIPASEIARILFLSAEAKPLPYTRQDVYNFCIRLYESEAMKAIADHMLDENWLPSHSPQYREAYRPAYRVVQFGFIWSSRF